MKSIIVTTDRNTLLQLVEDSNTYTDVLNKLGLVARGRNFDTLKKYIGIFGIDVSHFNPNKVRSNGLILANTIPFEQILVINSSYTNTNSLKKRLYKEGLLQPICSLCGQNEYWYGKKIALIMDHINGVHNDNRIENLRIVCPNCEATLDTHCGGNVRKVKKEAKRNKNLASKKLRCLNRRTIERPSLSVLEADILNLGYRQTGKKYGVSDNAIRKWVDTYKKCGW
jgi:hypothetical protein